jgi:uncharacterized phage-associated protein
MSKFKLDSRKAIEAAAILAGQSGGRISSKRLLALLYIASRECLKRSGRLLLGGRLVALQHGPIHSDVYDLIKKRDRAEGLAEWSKHFHNDGYYVVLDLDPGLNALSRFEARVLKEVLKRHQDEDDWDVARETHEFSEYATTYKKGSARTISLEQVIHAIRGLGPMAATIVRDLKEKDEIDELFASAKKQGRQRRQLQRKSERA